MNKSFTATAEMRPNGCCVVHLDGYLDAHTATQLEEKIHSVITQGCNRIVVDFADLEYISSAGLGVFMVFIEGVRAARGDLKLAAMKPKVFTVFDLLGFPILFEIHNSVQAALDTFPQEA